MYVRITTYKLRPGKREEALELARNVDPIIRSQKGFKQMYFFGDDETGEYGGMVLWDTKEDGQDAFNVVFPLVQQALQGRAQEPPKTGLYEVVEP